MNTQYREGHRSRKHSQGKVANPYPFATKFWSWWMAGWNDCDMGYPIERQRGN